MELKRHNKSGKKYSINKDFCRGGERRLSRHHGVSQQDETSDVSSDVSVSLHELSIEVKYLYITRKGSWVIRNSKLFMTRYKYATTELAIYIRT